MDRHKVEQQVRELYNKGEIYNGMRLCRAYIREMGSCVQINHLMAAGYYAMRQYNKAWYWIKENPKSELKERICNIVYKEMV